MQIVITGGTGFIGSVLAKHCLAAGATVTVLDNLCVGGTARAQRLPEAAAFSPIDITDRAALDSLFAERRPQLVYHLAAHHYIPFCAAHPQETYDVNVWGTHAVLSAAATVGAKVVVASSGAIYPSTDTPISEDLPAAPTDTYGLSKALTENIAAFFQSEHDLDCRIVRLFNVYGPGDPHPHLLPHIAASLKQSDTISLGNIKTKRDYVFVEDVAATLMAIGAHDSCARSTLNLGAGHEYSAEQIVAEIAGLLGRPVQIHTDPARLRPVDKMHQRADTRRLRDAVGSAPATPLREGLRALLRSEDLL